MPASKQRKAKTKAPRRSKDDDGFDSDNLDDSDIEELGKKRKRTGANTSGRSRTSKKSRRKRDEDSEESEFELQEGQEIVGIVAEAPKQTVPSGQISQNTLDFLAKLKDPNCNDRDWFKLHEPVYRVAEKEWKDFVEAFTDVLITVDRQIPPLPPKDTIHRIYRDVRFSNDKTPYKTNLSATFSRSGRKGIFAVYHVTVKPGNQSFIGAGTWCPSKNELASLRANIQRDPRRLRDIIEAPEFTRMFGEAKPRSDGGRQNIFGLEGELKKAPKGVEKDHPDIDLLKCRSFAVSHQFLDSEVLEPDFRNKLGEVAAIMRPFVHCLNDMMTILDEDEEGEE